MADITNGDVLGPIVLWQTFRLGNLWSIITRKDPDWADYFRDGSRKDLRLEPTITHSTFTMQCSLDRSGH